MLVYVEPQQDPPRIALGASHIVPNVPSRPDRRVNRISELTLV